MGIDYELEEFEGNDQNQETITATLTGEYLFSRRAALLANYQFVTQNDPGGDNDYHENRVSVGVRLRQ